MKTMSEAPESTVIYGSRVFITNHHRAQPWEDKPKDNQYVVHVAGSEKKEPNQSSSKYRHGFLKIACVYSTSMPGIMDANINHVQHNNLAARGIHTTR